MCGISGILSFGEEVNLKKLQSMTDTLSHRGPDDSGYWISSDKTMGLGHRRLSVIDLSENGKQPMEYLDGRYQLSYNGEIYNYRELKETLINKGYQFKTETDTEVLLALYDLKKEKCLDDLNGMFAFALWDNKEKELFCARDRFGEKPFYYCFYNDKFIFASEIKAIFSYGVPKKALPSLVYNYFVFGSIRDVNDLEKSFYQDIKSLRSSHYLKLGPNTNFTCKRYWDIDYHKQQQIGFNEAKEKFSELFYNSVKLRMRSDVKLGSSLSGGLDSSSIVSVLNGFLNGESMSSFSARFPGYARDEGKFIDLLLEKFPNINGLSVYPNEQSIASNFERICHHQDEPFGSFSIAAQYEVMKHAKDNDTVVLLDGQGADEVLGGYYKYYLTYLIELKKKDKRKYNSEFDSFSKFQNHKVNLSQKRKIRAVNPWIYKRTVGALRKKLPWTHPKFKGLNKELVHAYKSNEIPGFIPRNLKECLYQSVLGNDLSELLRYADRNSMAHSVEVRLPFLCHHLVEFAFSLPNDHVLKEGWDKIHSSFFNELCCSR